MGTDGRLGIAKLFGGQRETQVARGTFERPDEVERGLWTNDGEHSLRWFRLKALRQSRQLIIYVWTMKYSRASKPLCLPNPCVHRRRNGHAHGGKGISRQLRATLSAPCVHSAVLHIPVPFDVT